MLPSPSRCSFSVVLNRTTLRAYPARDDSASSSEMPALSKRRISAILRSLQYDTAARYSGVCIFNRSCVMENGMARRDEVQAKLAQLHALMASRKLDAILLEQTPNVAWLTAGAETAINIAADRGPLALLVTPERACVVTDGVEAPRLEAEEELVDLGFELVVEPWYRRGAFIADMRARGRVGSDDERDAMTVAPDIQRLRTTLQPSEVARLRHACLLAADVLREVVASVAPGITERAIAGMLDGASRARGGVAVVTLVGSDERIAAYRHPLPTGKVVERYVMLVLCLRWHGLVAATTRLVHFGSLPDNLEARAHAVAAVDSRIIQGTQAGRTLAEQWELAARAYRD